MLLCFYFGIAEVIGKLLCTVELLVKIGEVLGKILSKVGVEEVEVC
jgi:hypothetical protein